MPKPELSTIPPFYHKYVNLVDEDDVTKAIEDNTQKTLALLQSIPVEKWDDRYAEGKWTIKELIQHVIDTDRIFAYRALCIARGEEQSLPGFDEVLYAANSEANRRSREELLEELTAVRQSLILLFRSFSNEQLNRFGRANNNAIGVNGIGFIAVGHMQHHLNILNERYLS